MKLVDLATALAPELPQKIVGIRPGEKLHESLITEDDARSTIEMDDRFIILPNIKFWTDHAFDNLPRVPPDFTYTSDKNPRMLDIEGFLHLMAEDASTAELAEAGSTQTTVSARGR
jgi:UDP-N-acetylglucosamine 4,6-dehydratase